MSLSGITIRYEFEHHFSEKERIRFWPISLLLSNKSTLAEGEALKIKLLLKERARFDLFYQAAKKQIKNNLNEIRFICAEIKALEQAPDLFIDTKKNKKKRDSEGSDKTFTSSYQLNLNEMASALSAHDAETLLSRPKKAKCVIL
ncbi:MAG: hypothetical protein BGO43_13975 [Gammaproteobacteria bacterium 39-13]|nr:hypothetical protein [Gammaproteobacteria bacterium]OJV85792.1 MAG: hypothetical protein BGO43_13975 [Gammaproteobacteria bacterium 39-13]